MKLIIDNREHDLIQKINQCEKQDYLQIEIQTLPLGDCLLTTDDDKAVLLYERKTFTDLFASIKDGRYEEQSYRMLNDEQFPNKKDIVYILEGMYSQFTQPSDKKLLLSSLTSLFFFKGFSVLRTSSVQDTADTILGMTDKLHRDFEKGKQRNSCTVTSYSNVVKKVKKDNITKDNIGEIMLSQVPGISNTTAAAIMSCCDNSVDKFIQTLKSSPETIEQLKIGEKQRKINKKSVEVLKSFFIE